MTGSQPHVLRMPEGDADGWQSALQPLWSVMCLLVWEALLFDLCGLVMVSLVVALTWVEWVGWSR